MLFSQENVSANIRNRDGKRVFFLREGDTLTPSARDWLNRERISILPAIQAKIQEFQLENGAILQEKPEDYTHLRGNILVPKTHPVIAFRGKMDSLQAQLLLTQALCPREGLEEILALARNIIRWDVLEEPARMDHLLGLSPQQLRQHSHDPQTFYGIPHFMPEPGDGEAILRLNLCRCAAREAELAAAHAFGRSRMDLLQALNRISSAIYLLMILEKGERHGTTRPN